MSKENKLWFCEKCQKIVPDSEVQPSLFRDSYDKMKQLLDRLKELDPDRSIIEPDNRQQHIYTETVNAYQGRQVSGQIGYCPIEHTIYCGYVREPTDQEYFIFHTLKITL